MNEASFWGAANAITPNHTVSEASTHYFSAISSHFCMERQGLEPCHEFWTMGLWILNHGVVLGGYLFKSGVHQAFQDLFSPKTEQIISLSLITDPQPSHPLLINSGRIPRQDPNLSKVCCHGNSLEAESKVPQEIFKKGSNMDVFLIIFALNSNHRTFGLDFGISFAPSCKMLFFCEHWKRYIWKRKILWQYCFLFMQMLFYNLYKGHTHCRKMMWRLGSCQNTGRFLFLFKNSFI